METLELVGVETIPFAYPFEPMLTSLASEVVVLQEAWLWGLEKPYLLNSE